MTTDTKKYTYLSIHPSKYNPKANTKPFMKFLEDVLGNQRSEFLKFMGDVIRKEHVRCVFYHDVPSSGMETLICCINEVLSGHFGKVKLDSLDLYLKHVDTKDLGAFIYMDNPVFFRDTIGKTNYKQLTNAKFPSEWTPIFVTDPHNTSNHEIHSEFSSRYYSRKLYNFHFRTSFVDVPKHSAEKKINRNMEKRLLYNKEDKEGVLKVMLDSTRKSTLGELLSIRPEDVFIHNRQPSFPKYSGKDFL